MPAGLCGGVSIEDDWPRGPYLLVRVTRRAKFHERRLKRIARFPRNLRTVKVGHSERMLRRIQNRIDFEAHSADGFHVRVIGVDISAGRVEVAEYDDRVVIGVVERVPNGSRTLEAVGAQHVVTLSRPLGDGKVIDATTGRRVRHASGGS